MRASSLSVLGSGGEAGLPAEVERLLCEVVADGFVVYCCGPRAAPFALVAAYQWEDYVDLVTIRCSSLPDRAGMRAARLAAVMATIRYRFDYG